MNVKRWYVKAAVTVALIALIAGCATSPRERICFDCGGNSFVHSGGDVVLYSDQRSTETGRLDSAGGWQIAVPTAQATATPGLLINSSAAGSNLLEVRKASTPVAYIPNSGGLRIDGGLTDIGGGSCGVADGDNDVCIAAVLEVDGEAEFDGAIDADSTSDFADTATFSKGSGNALVVSAGGAIDANGTSDFADTATFSKGSGTALSVSAGGLAVFGGGAEVNGTITLENDETISNSTDDVVAISGMVGARQYVVDKTADYTVTLAESGALFTNDGASGAITFTLPSPSLGTMFGFIAQDDQDVFLVPASGDQILSETNAADDHLGQATQYGVIWLVSDGTNWLPVYVLGTWDDEDG